MKRNTGFLVFVFLLVFGAVRRTCPAAKAGCGDKDPDSLLSPHCLVQLIPGSHQS